jgi:hypothetical protein
MADEPEITNAADEIPPPDTLMPLDEDAYEPDPGVPRGSFAYIGAAKTADEFTTYVEGFNFGHPAPDFIVLHHTWSPGTVYTTPNWPVDKQWDGGETAGMSDAEIRRRRLRRLEQLRDFYANERGWSIGPHLFIDNRYIWLFTPMDRPGAHASDNWGNFFDRGGVRHFSIGVEVVGLYDNKPWPDDVARLVGHAVAVLKRKLGTFELRYLYPNGSPGRVWNEPKKRWLCAHPDQLQMGGISSHRDYNKPECPGAKITEQFYMDVLQRGWQNLQSEGH